VSTRLVVGVFSPSVLLRVARRLGILAEHDLDVEEVAVASSPGQFRSLLDGELDAAVTSPDNVVAYRFCPDNPLGTVADAKIVSAIDRGMGLGLYPRAGETAESLRHTTWAVDVATSGFAFAMYALAESIGLSREGYEVVALGSTPRRLEALLAGECAATMLSAGSELRAEQAGLLPLARVATVCRPYLGTVLAVVGDNSLDPALRLAAALRTTGQAICAGQADDVTVDEAAAALAVPHRLAQRYLGRLQDPDEGLVPDGRVDTESLTTVVELRRRYLPCVVDGVDVLSRALDPQSGLVVAEGSHQP
jgi:ABC-type nitrate/sulfonate/bicarbonate transport system substrate-binding protein